MSAATGIDRLPPFDGEAEDAVIASLMVQPERIPDVVGLGLTPREFFHERNGWAFEAELAVYELSGSAGVNVITVASEMARVDRLEAAGGQTWLHQIIRELTTAEGAPYYAGIVERTARYRRLIHMLSSGLQLAYTAPDDYEAVTRRIVEGVMRTGSGRVSGRAATASETLYDGGLAGWIEGHMDDPRRLAGVSTGYSELDDLVDGLQVGNVYTLAAETSAGKSLMAHNLVRKLGSDGVPMLLFSTEMSARTVGRRMVYLEAGLDPLVPRKRGSYWTGERDAVRDAMEWYDALPLTVYSGPLSFPALLGEVRRVKASKLGCQVVFVDHVDHVGGGAQNRVQELEALMRDLKTRLALGEEVALVIVSHMSRGLGGKMGRLKNSSSKEQDSDVVMFLQPVRRGDNGEWVEMSQDESAMEKARSTRLFYRLEVFKNREGSTGFVPLMLSWEHGGRFYPLARGGGE